MSWKPVGAVLPAELVEARLQLHWATQLVSAPGTSLLPAKSDYSHTNLVWDTALGVLTGRELGAQQRRAGLVFEGLELIVIEGPRERDSLRLAGHTMEQALAWLGGRFCGDRQALALPSHEMPAHPLGEGGSFNDARPRDRVELAAWFADAALVLRDAIAAEAAASPVRCWPHHFDVASLITLDANREAEEARSIGVGFSPGDRSYAQPYFYVTPWPYPRGESLPALSSGARWHTDGWTGAVLTGEHVISAPPDAQQETVARALRDAVGACRALLGA